ncbi:MAG: hypothetical protein ACP5I4_09440 [Oceanipulchritudo sp.]
MNTVRNSFLIALLLTTNILAAATIPMDNGSGDYLEVGTNDPATNDYVFSGTVNPYNAGAPTGLRYTGGATLTSEATFSITNLQGSPLVGAINGTTVSYSGYWSGDGGQSKSQLVLQGGSTWRLEAGAHLSFILDGSLFTRQLWVLGDGTGTLELAEGFVADLTAGGTVGDGIAAIRQSNNTLVTHHTQSLPVSPRPDGSGGLQINGHMVFENEGGSVWITRTNPQVYPGAVWIGVDTTFRMESELTHTGVTQFSSWSGSYWADNAFQTTSENVNLTKTGSADLIFAAETAFLPGTTFTVEEGGLVFQTDPASGMRKGSSNTVEGGPNLQLFVGGDGTEFRNARVRFEAPLSRIASLSSLQGRLDILGVVEMQSFSSNHQDNLPDTFPPPPFVYTPSIVHFELDTVSGQLLVTGEAALGGELLITRADGFDPPAGTTFDLIIAGSISSGPNGTIPRFESVEDQTGLGLEIDYLTDRVRATTTHSARTTGVVIDEDWTDGAFDAPGWSIVNAQVGFRATGRPEIPFALTRPVDVSFVWNAATIDVPAFFVNDEEVLIIRMTTFSDVAYNNQEYSKPEVACLHLNEHAQFGHDHATETSRNYFTLGDWQQLKPSVENDDAVAFSGIHHAGGDNATNLSQNDTSLTIFRPDGANTNSEAHGMRNQQQATHSRALQHWNNILISLPRGHDPNKAPVLRTGVSLVDALVGMSHAHVGVTRRTDVNLDYATDAHDFIYWNSHNGTTGTLLWSGDIDNDGNTDGDDLALWGAEAGTVHDPSFSQSVARLGINDLPGTGTPPDFVYDWASGALTVTTNGSAVSAWILPAPAAGSVEPAWSTGSWWQARVRGAEHWADTGLTGLTGSQIVATFSPYLDPSGFGEAIFGYAAGGGGTVAVVVSGIPTTYTEWTAAYGLSGSDALPEAIPFGDGVTNRMKYGLGMHGNAPAGPMPGAQLIPESGSDYLVLSFTRPAGRTDLVTTGWVSNDLANWTSDPAEVSVDIHDNGDGTETVTIRAAAPVAFPDSPVFLKVTFSISG